MSEAFYHLTGMPTVGYKISTLDEKKLYKLLNDFDEDDFSTTAISIGSKAEGLLKNHGYTVVDVKEYNNEYMVKLRNPWGSETFKGDWHDGDTAKWTKEAKKALQPLPIEDGVFWMEMDDFKKNFSHFHTSMYQEWQTDMKEATWDRTKDPKTEGKKWGIINPVGQRVVVGLAGVPERMFMDNKCDTKQKIDTLPFSLFQIKDDKSTLIKDDHGSNGIGWLRASSGFGWLIFENLPEGQYILKTRKSKGDKKPQHTGVMPFSVLSFGEKQQAKIEPL